MGGRGEGERGAQIAEGRIADSCVFLNFSGGVGHLVHGRLGSALLTILLCPTRLLRSLTAVEYCVFVSTYGLSPTVLMAC